MSKQSMVERHRAKLKGLAGKQVEIGWFETDRYPADPDRKRKGGQHVSAVAYWLDNGTARIPARPFFKVTFIENQEGAKKLIINNTASYLAETFSGGPDAVLGQVGLYFERLIIKKIKSQQFAPLSKPYYRWKEKFHASPQILIDTGHLWKTLTSRVS